MAKLIFSLTSSDSLDFPLNADLIRMGRHPGNDIVINNSWISSHHAEFRREAGQLVLRDLQSSNGTAVNGSRITEQILIHGDRIAFGQLEAVYDAEVSVTDGAVARPTPEVRPVPVVKPVAAPVGKVIPAPSMAGTTPVREPVQPAPAPVVVGKAMAPPAATIAYDTARKEMSAELGEIQKKTIEAQAVAESARQERDTAREELARVKAALAAAQQEFAAWQESERVARATHASDARLEADAARQTADEAKAALVRVQEEIRLAQQELDRIGAEKQSAQAQLASTRAETERANAGLSGLRAELTGLRESLAAGESARAAGREKADALAAQVTASEEALIGVQEALAAARASLASTSRDHATAQEKILGDTKAAAAELDRLQLAHQTLAAEHTALQEGAQLLHAEAAAWPARQQAAEAERDRLRAALQEAHALAAAEEAQRSARREAMAELEREYHSLSEKVVQWRELEAGAGRTAARLAADQEAAMALQQAMAGAVAQKETALAEAAALANRQAALLAETRVLEGKLDNLRRETEGAAALNAKVADLRQQQGEAERRLDILNDRLHGMSEAPDPNWGTVHSLARSFIKKLDLIDDLISHLANRPEAAETLDQLSIFRSGLLDILKEYSIEAYSLEPGTVIDVAARKRIQIVETLSEGSHDGTRIVRTYRPGYVCLNGDLGIPTLLRKADVAVSIAMS